MDGKRFVRLCTQTQTQALFLVFVFALLLALICGCTASPAPSPDAASPIPSPDASYPAPSPDASYPAEQTVVIGGEEFAVRNGRAVEPECAWDIADKSIADFGPFFAARYPTQTQTRTLLQGTAAEAEITELIGEGEGPTLYVVAGLHGDERAGWFAGTLLKGVTLKAGRLCVLAPANAAGARELVREMPDGRDLNRSFAQRLAESPTETELFAAALYEDIRASAPAAVFDLHEANVVKEGRDFLGSTLIITTLDGMEDMFPALLLATQKNGLTAGPYTMSGPGPKGSINQTVSGGLSIPVITVETFRGYAMERRVADDLAIMEYALTYYGMR